ncbi:MAG: GNAT family N-acetyltransferase [Ferruginibacter sp.]
MIRPFQTGDKPILIEIFKLNTPQFFDPKELADFDNYLDKYSKTYLTIEQNDKIVGGTGYQISNDNLTGSITWIFFHPDQAGQGLGKQAVEHCLTVLKANKNLETLAVRTSQLAFKFFEKFGFKLIRTKKDYWGHGLDLYEMEVKLKD